VDQEMSYLVTDDVSKFITLHGYVEHSAVVRHLHEADVLLISLSSLPGAEKIITGKVFEYMATGKHILAVVPEGETQFIVQNDYDNATIADPINIEEIKEKMRMIMDGIGGIRMKKGCCSDKYLRINLTRELASLFNELVCN